MARERTGQMVHTHIPPERVEEIAQETRELFKSQDDISSFMSLKSAVVEMPTSLVRKCCTYWLFRVIPEALHSHCPHTVHKTVKKKKNILYPLISLIWGSRSGLDTRREKVARCWICWAVWAAFRSSRCAGGVGSGQQVLVAVFPMVL